MALASDGSLAQRHPGYANGAMPRAGKLYMIAAALGVSPRWPTTGVDDGTAGKLDASEKISPADQLSSPEALESERAALGAAD